MSDVIPFTYEGSAVRTLLIDGEPWFVLADLCKVLDLSNPTMVADRVDSDALSTAEVIDAKGRTQTARIVSESGMYQVIFMSRKPEATAATHAAAAANHSTNSPTSKQKPPQLQLRGPVVPKGTHAMDKRTAPQPRRALVIDGQMVTTDDATKPRRAK